MEIGHSLRPTNYYFNRLEFIASRTGNVNFFYHPTVEGTPHRVSGCSGLGTLYCLLLIENNRLFAEI